MHASPAPSQNALPTSDVMEISSDEDSDATDTERDHDKTDADDHLPSIAEIVSRIEKAERGRSNTAGEPPQSVCVILIC